MAPVGLLTQETQLGQQLVVGRRHDLAGTNEALVAGDGACHRLDGRRRRVTRRRRGLLVGEHRRHNELVSQFGHDTRLHRRKFQAGQPAGRALIVGQLRRPNLLAHQVFDDR